MPSSQTKNHRHWSQAGRTLILLLETAVLMDGDDSSNCSSSLSAAAAAAANNNAYDVIATKKKKTSPATATNDDDGSKNLKRKERLEQNRISARESRKRKKNMIEELQRTVITLSREHKELTQRNETLKQQMADLNEKVREIRNHCS